MCTYFMYTNDKKSTCVIPNTWKNQLNDMSSKNDIQIITSFFLR